MFPLNGDRYIIKCSLFSKLALGNLLSMKKALLFTETTLELKDNLQSSPGASPSPFVGVL
jgi:hypothetical protein